MPNDFRLNTEGAQTVADAIKEFRKFMEAKRAARGKVHGLERRYRNDRRVGDRRSPDTQPGEQT